jgi:ADP-ribosylglycohydrolase
LESSDYLNAVSLAVSLGSDSDTIGCITGGIQKPFTDKFLIVLKKVLKILPKYGLRRNQYGI